MPKRSKPSWVKEIAMERILKLLGFAEENAKARPDRSKRYVELARKISTRYTVPIPQNLKKKFCKACNAFWVPGKNLKVRANARTKSIDYVCLECGERRRHGYAKKRMKK